MALSRLNYNSLNVTAAANKGIGFDSGADDLSTDFSGGAIRFIKKLTASSSATLSFVDGSASVVLDNTYKEYLFIFNNIHPETNAVAFSFNGSIDSGSNYNVAKTSTHFGAYHDETDTAAAVAYRTDEDLAQGTGFQPFQINFGTGGDQCGAGYLHLFNPSSTTFVKHFMIKSNQAHYANATLDANIAGYGNTTSAVDAIQFKMASGNIDAGTFKLYGIKDS